MGLTKKIVCQINKQNNFDGNLTRILLIFTIFGPWKRRAFLRASDEWIPFVHNYNPLLIRNRSKILTIHKARILRKRPLEKTFLDLKKWVKSTQTVGCNGVRKVYSQLTTFRTQRPRKLAAGGGHICKFQNWFWILQTRPKNPWN